MVIMVSNKILGKARISSQFQITVPKELREYLGVKSGDSIIFNLADDGQVYLKAQEALTRPTD